MKGIYLIENKITKKVYVGSSVKLKSREQRHFKDLDCGTHHSNKLQNSYNKHGKGSFEFKILESYNKIEYQKLLNREQYWIDSLDSYHNGYNCRPKAESNYGHKHTEETKKRLSMLNSGKNNAMYGKKLTNEHKKKIGDKIRGRKDTPDTIRKKRLAGLSRKHTEETKKKQMMVKKSKPILQLDLNGNIVKEWYSRREPERELGIIVNYTVKSIKKLKCGYYWVYKDEYNLFMETIN